MDMYNNHFNTIGIGNPVMPGRSCMTGADFANDKNRGSGDLFPIAGESPRAYWSEEYRKMYEEGLKRQEAEKDKIYGPLEERPMLVFTDEKIEDSDYHALCGGKPTLAPGLYDMN